MIVRICRLSKLIAIAVTINLLRPHTSVFSKAARVVEEHLSYRFTCWQRF